ncbi:MAG: serine/threonine protein kinase [Proteobacteria bacterium]|nr:serine/threonine protein kinase [Pseudomonadota bacterium]
MIVYLAMDGDWVTAVGGTLINGKYRVVRLVGMGGMGAVYEATHVVTSRRVAVKQLQSKYIGDERVVQRFHQEARLAASIGHENICEVIDQGVTDDGLPYLVMPLLVGCSLADLLKQEGRLSLVRTKDIACQVLDALETAHSAKIVHRDLKPGNIYIARSVDRIDFVKLLDFGISKVLDQDLISDLTKSGVVLGTPHYMAPEQAKGSKHIDHRVDLYAIGVILYEAFTGRKPFKGDSYNEVMYKIISEPFPAPASLNPSIHPAIETVVLRAMARHPDDRFDSAAEMREALQNAVAKRTASDIGTSITSSTTIIGKTSAESLDLPSDSNTDKRSKHTSNNHYLLIIGLLTSVIVVFGISAWILLINPDERNQTPVVTASNLSTVRIPDGDPKESGSNLTDKGVQIEVLGAPKEVKIYYENSLILENPFRVKFGKTIAQLRVEAEGYNVFRVSIIPSKDQIIEVAMRPIAKDSTVHKKVFDTLRLSDSQVKSKKKKSAATSSPSVLRTQAKSLEKASVKDPEKKEFTKAGRGTVIAEDFE